jgi:radical SAM protein with 4Fe4S-binding SPASM domain
MNETYFFSKKIDNKAYLIYNSSKHLPAVFNKQGKQYLEIISQNSNYDESLKLIKLSEHEEFTEFYNYIQEVGFLETNMNTNFDDFIEKNIVNEKKHFYFHLTDRCNLKCNYCYNEDKRDNFLDLPLEKWIKIIDKTIQHIGSITITGGEPFLYKDFDKLLEYLRKNRNDIQIDTFSNGNIDYANNKKNFKIFNLLDKITISCDNIRNDDHDRKGFNIDIFKKNIEWIKKNGFENKISLNSVIVRNKLDEVKKVREYAKTNNLNFTYALRLPNKCSDKKYLPTLTEYKDIIFNNKLIINKPSSNNEIPLTIKCGAAGNTISIDSQGNCYPCQNFHYPEFHMGNLLNVEFKSVMSSEAAFKLRKHHILNVEKCNECNLRFVCGGGCPADTYKLYKDLTKHPKILCPYYKIGAINTLISTEYEEE